jgi:hypothetical protein
VSQNFVFNKDKEIQDIGKASELLGLQSKGESEHLGELKTPAAVVPKGLAESLLLTPDDDRCRITTEPITYPPRPSQAVDRNYHQLNNLLARPTTRALREPLDICCPIESSAAKQKEKISVETHIAYAYLSAVSAEIRLAEKDPWDLREAKEASNWENWKAAIKDELNQLEEMKTWKLVDLPEGCEPIRNKWVFIRK